MGRIASWLTEYFIEKRIIKECDRDLYIYGFDITLYTFISFSALLCYSAVWGKLYTGVVLITVFSLCQSHGGGYHERTHLRCFLVMFIGLTFVLCLSLIPLSIKVYSLCGGIAFCVLLLIPLVLHKNKAYLRSQQISLIRKSRVYTCICLVGGVILGFSNIELFEASCCGLVCAALSRVYALYWQRKE